MNHFKRMTTAVAVASTLCATQAAHATIVNGGFETGSFAGWTVAGFGMQSLTQNAANHTTANYLADAAASSAKASSDAVITSQTTAFGGTAAGTAVTPRSGSYLAFVSNETAAGSNTLAGSSISQLFTVGAGDLSLSFDVDFLSNETIGSAWDFGGIALVGTNGEVLAQYTLDDLPSGPANAHATSVAAGGFSASSGWRTSSFDLVPFAGQTLKLIAFATNTGDTSVESRLLVDNIAVNAAVPEPSALLLLALGGAALLTMPARSRRRVA